MDQPEWRFAARLVDDLLSVRIQTRKKPETDGDSGEEVAH